MDTMQKAPLLFAALILAGCASVQSDWEFTRRLNRPCGYEVFAEKYPASDLAREAQSKVAELHWEDAAKENSIAAYEEFLEKHPGSRFLPLLRENVDILHWEQAVEEDLPEAYGEFLIQYPDSRFAPQAREEIAWDEAVTTDSEGAYEKYLADYPAGRYAAEAGQAVDTFLWQNAREQNTAEAYRVYLKRYPGGRFARDAERAIEIAKRLEACTPVSPVMVKQIEEEVLTFMGNERERSLIEYVEDFRYSVIGLSREGEGVDLTEYTAEGRKRKAEVHYYVASDEEGGREHEDTGSVAWQSSERAVVHRKVTAAGSTLKLKDGRIFMYGNGTWNQCDF
ncbi:MAG: hypothetical protein JSU90_12655 [Nitrospiraceae bacterium]|nr:MAG: hypothetical protein JSU90_12655 [Nitrospiraceae bacterium]